MAVVCVRITFCDETVLPNQQHSATTCSCDLVLGTVLKSRAHKPQLPPAGGLIEVGREERGDKRRRRSHTLPTSEWSRLYRTLQGVAPHCQRHRSNLHRSVRNHLSRISFFHVEAQKVRRYVYTIHQGKKLFHTCSSFILFLVCPSTPSHHHC